MLSWKQTGKIILGDGACWSIRTQRRCRCASLSNMLCCAAFSDGNPVLKIRGDGNVRTLSVQDDEDRKRRITIERDVRKGLKRILEGCEKVKGEF